MNLQEENAWALLTKEMVGGLHQYDHWDEVPSKVKKQYIDKAVPKLLLDLGMQYANDKSKRKQRYGRYICPFCETWYRANTYQITNGTSTKCRSCAATQGNRKRSLK